jgi:hypothetical protein
MPTKVDDATISMDVDDVDATLEPVALPPPLEVVGTTGAVAAGPDAEADEEIVSTMSNTAAKMTWKSIVDGTKVIQLTSPPGTKLGLTLIEINNHSTGRPCGLQIVAIDPKICTFGDKVSVGDVMVEIDGREVKTLADATTKTSSMGEKDEEQQHRSIIICKREYYLN